MLVNDKKIKIILTGATGVIGAGIVRQCIKNGWEVCAAVRPDSPKNQYIEGLGATIIQCDLKDISDLAENSECRDADYFIHLGWMGTKKAERENRSIQQKNVEYAIKACEVAAQIGCKAFVFAGSQAEYGRLEGAMTPDLPTNPESEYGKAKLEAGAKTKEICARYGMRHIYTRILSVYGPCNEPDTMVMSTISKLLKGKEPQFTPGEQLWDYMYSDDAARALLMLAQFGKDNQIYCIGSGEFKPLKEYIRIIGNVVNPEIALGIGKIPYSDNQIMKLYADIDLLKKDTGFEPEISFEEGIRLTTEWMIQNDMLGE